MRLALVFFAVAALSAQDRYLQPSKNIDVCGRVELEGEIRPGGGYAPHTTGGLKGAGSDGTIHWQTGVEFFPPDARKDVSKFAATEESGQLVPLAGLKGKVVVVGLWSTTCEPSLYLLGELAKLQPRGLAGGFEILPINFDPEGWRLVNKFLRQERMKKMFSGVKLYTPALGSQGVHLFMDMVPALPTFFIIDREGRFAAQGTGYKDWEVLRCLQTVLNEKSAPAATTEKTNTATF